MAEKEITKEESKNSNGENLRDDAKEIHKKARNFLSRLLNIREDTDRESTVEAVKKDISFKGH